MPRYTLRCQMLAPQAALEVFRVFENPYNLAQITPPWLNFRVTSKEAVVMRAGAEIEYTIRWLGLPIFWRTLITQYEPPFLFVDEQVRGPYPLWHHRHTFEETSAGTVVSDHVDYALPFGVLGAAMNSTLVGRQLREIFRYRQTALAQLFGPGSRLLSEPTIR